MRRTEVLEGVRLMKFRDVFGRCARRELSKLEAAELLGVSERTFRRWCRRFEAEGEAGLHDRRLGLASAKRVPADAAMRVEGLYRERYEGFTARHFHEHLVRDHGFRWGYTWTKTFLHGRGLAMPAARRCTAAISTIASSRGLFASGFRSLAALPRLPSIEDRPLFLEAGTILPGPEPVKATCEKCR